MIEKADKMKIEISKNIASMDIATGDAIKELREEEAHSRDELTNMIENIQGSLGETQVKLNEDEARVSRRQAAKSRNLSRVQWKLINSVIAPLSSSNWIDNTFTIASSRPFGKLGFQTKN